MQPRRHGRPSAKETGVALLSVLALLIAPATQANPPDQPGSTEVMSVIVEAEAGSSGDAELLIAHIGGAVESPLEIINGFAASVPENQIATLAASEHVTRVTPDSAVQLAGVIWESSAILDGAAAETSPGSLYEATNSVNARSMWAAGHTGSGIDIALIDSGVAPVDGLTVPGKVINGPDLSFESQYDNLRYLDTFGHGTHLAGIIAGRDDEIVGNPAAAPPDQFLGVAPDARIVSIKVADAHGVTDVSQVIAAIDWVVQNRQSGDLDIRVLSLSFGTDSGQSYLTDPLAFAVEQAWHSGIVVVVAAGNDGNSHPLRNPAMDPYVIAVGASDPNGTSASGDDFVAEFSNCGTASRPVDVVAPGRSVTSLRAPGSYVDQENPEAVVSERLFIGSGTSQAAAAVSGAVALLLDENGSLQPDQVKSLLMSEATSGIQGSGTCSGVGAVDALAAAEARVPKNSKVAQKHPLARGDGSLEASRGSDHLTADGVLLQGEQDIMGSPWIGFIETANECWEEGKGRKATTVCEDVQRPVETLWDGGSWNGAPWSGTSWSGTSWSGTSWSGTSWSGTSWSGTSWSGTSWSAAAWQDPAWTGSSWSGTSWSGTSWSGTSWSGTSWSGAGWLGFSWGW